MRCLESVGLEPLFPVVRGIVALEPDGSPLIAAIGHIEMTAVRVLLHFATDHSQRVG